MIAHSFKGEAFGPAQRLHGATYTIEAEFASQELVKPQNWVLDIGFAFDLMKEACDKYNYRNLDEMFPNDNTTTEFVCKLLFDFFADRLRGSFKGDICMKLWESHNAWASYKGTI